MEFPKIIVNYIFLKIRYCKKKSMIPTFKNWHIIKIEDKLVNFIFMPSNFFYLFSFWISYFKLMFNLSFLKYLLTTLFSSSLLFSCPFFFILIHDTFFPTTSFSHSSFPYSLWGQFLFLPTLTFFNQSFIFFNFFHIQCHLHKIIIIFRS
jgi:hypothetical protein